MLEHNDAKNIFIIAKKNFLQQFWQLLFKEMAAYNGDQLIKKSKYYFFLTVLLTLTVL